MKIASRRAFTLIEILLVVVILGILLAIATPNFVTAREQSRAAACISNLKAIDAAKEQYALDNRLQAGATVRMRTLLNGYIKNPSRSRNFTCPSSGLRYSSDIGVIGEPPECPTTAAHGGKYAHRLPG